MISTRDLSGLPDIRAFRRLTRALAMLDAILSPEWESRYYSFNSHWAEGEMMASMRNGSGDQWSALLSSAGVALAGLAHESPMLRPGTPRPGLFAGLPAEFQASFLHEPAFDTANATFCIWRRATEDRWSCGTADLFSSDDTDGSAALLAILAGDVDQYVEFARDYYETDIAPADVAALYRHDRLSNELVRRLNPRADLRSLAADIDEIGYPGSG